MGCMSGRAVNAGHFDPHLKKTTKRSNTMPSEIFMVGWGICSRVLAAQRRVGRKRGSYTSTQEHWL